MNKTKIKAIKPRRLKDTWKQQKSLEIHEQKAQNGGKQMQQQPARTNNF